MFRYRTFRALDTAVTSAYAELVRDGFRDEARPLLEEFFFIDKACLLAELRCLMLDHGCSLDRLARFDR